ncbi:MAG TPA: hypothetical protein VHT01_10610 [Candidatus Udaeobacter sp.]|jgi:hypothetical protein|nr:hypothetical protein [Candidatus Udaeobacter sp.]
MMGEGKNGFINWSSLKTRLLQAVDNERRQDPHAAPALMGLLKQNLAAPNN